MIVLIVKGELQQIIGNFGARTLGFGFQTLFSDNGVYLWHKDRGGSFALWRHD